MGGPIPSSSFPLFSATTWLDSLGHVTLAFPLFGCPLFYVYTVTTGGMVFKMYRVLSGVSPWFPVRREGRMLTSIGPFRPKCRHSLDNVP
jgi:hypothetical protein